MRKIIFIILAFINFILPACADNIPVKTTDINNYGFGVLNLPTTFNIYEQPSLNSKILKTIDYKDSSYNPSLDFVPSYVNTVIAYVPSKSVALVVVLSNEENGWYEIYYDQKNGKTGWVKQDDTDSFKTWREAFSFWGKKYGIYLFKDVKSDDKALYSQEGGEGQRLYDFTYAKYITFSTIHGNWMLATVVDIGNNTKIGWIRWRKDDGTLLLFPSFKD